jgi:hypothetical protein
LPILQLPISGTNIIYSSQEGLPELREVKGRLIISDTRFEDSSIRNSISSQADITIPRRASSPVSKDQGFTKQSPIPGRFQEDNKKEIEIQTRFEQQQQEKQ